MSDNKFAGNSAYAKASQDTLNMPLEVGDRVPVRKPPVPPRALIKGTLNARCVLVEEQG